MAPLAAYAGSWGMGTPSPNSAEEKGTLWWTTKPMFTALSAGACQSSRQI